MIFTEDGQEWIETTNHLDIANQRRVFVRGRTIEPDPLAELREKCFRLAEKWTDSSYETILSPQHYAAELKRILT